MILKPVQMDLRILTDSVSRVVVSVPVVAAAAPLENWRRGFPVEDGLALADCTEVSPGVSCVSRR